MGNDNEAEPRERATVSATTSKVTIAFPFSQIRTHETSAELRDLTRIVVEIADRLAKLHPSAEIDQLADNARALFTKLDR
jgi:hypothetical protein